MLDAISDSTSQFAELQERLRNTLFLPDNCSLTSRSQDWLELRMLNLPQAQREKGVRGWSKERKQLTPPSKCS